MTSMASAWTTRPANCQHVLGPISTDLVASGGIRCGGGTQGPKERGHPSIDAQSCDEWLSG